MSDILRPPATAAGRCKPGSGRLPGIVAPARFKRDSFAAGAVENWQVIDGIPEFGAQVLDTSIVEATRVVETDPATDPRWERLVARQPNGSIYHHPAWLRSLHAEYGQRQLNLACEDFDGRLLAILPMFYTKGLPFRLGKQVTGRRLTSLPRTPLGGPLSIARGATQRLLHVAVEQARGEPGIQIQLKTQSAELDGLVEELVCTPWRQSYVLELSGDPSRPRSSNAVQRHRVKWAVNKATKLGLQVRAADRESELLTWYQLYLDTMRRNVVPPRPYRFFKALWDLLRPAGLMELLVAERAEGGLMRILAGSMVLAYGNTASYVFTGSKREDLAFHPNDILQWHAIQEASRKGLRWYDFGEVSEDHQQLALFKGKWGAEPVQLYRYYYPYQPPRALPARASEGQIRRLTRAAWWLPLTATAAAGDWLYSHL